MTTADHEFMALALRLAQRGMWTAHPNPRVGCVIVADGNVVGQCWHERAGEPHAEVLALAAAGDRAAGSTAYVTLEPCCHQGRTPPCTESLIKAGVTRVVFAAEDPDPRVAGGGARALTAGGIAVQGGLMAAESRALNPGFISRMERQQPWVRTKIAASLDGRVALADGSSHWISSEASRQDSHRLRARSSAILTGIGTVLADDPELTVRLPLPAGFVQPERIVLDSRLRTPPSARLLRAAGVTRLITTVDDARLRATLEATGAVVQVVPEQDGRPDLAAILSSLAAGGVNELMVEAGPRLNGALLDAGLIDEIVYYLAPQVIGAAGLGMFEGRVLTDMFERHAFELADSRRVGPDLRLRFLRKAN